MEPTKRLPGSPLRWGMLAGTPAEAAAELSAARESMRQGRFEEAEITAARLLRHSAASPQSSREYVITQPLQGLRGSAMVIRGLAARRQGRKDDARRFLKEAATTLGELAVAGHQFDPATLADYGIALLLTGQAREACGPFTDALEADANVPSDLILQLADALRRGGSNEEAARLLRAAHQRYPRYATIAAALARALERTGEHQLSVDAHITAGMLLAQDGRLVHSLDHFARAKELAPPGALLPALGYAQVLLVRGDLDKAEQAIDAIVQEHPDIAGAYALQAQLLGRRNNRTEALRIAEQALGRFRNDPWLIITRIQLLIELEEFDVALDALRQALTLEPGDPDLLRLMAECVRRAGGSVDEVAGVLRRLTTTAPLSVEYHLALADTLADAGRYEEAVKGLKSALRTLPHEPRLLGRQAELLARQGQHYEAVEFAREALEQGDELPQVAAQLAESLLAIGDEAGAVAAASQALRENDGLVAARRIRGLARVRRGEIEKAIKDFKKVLAAEPGDEETRKALVEALERRGRDLLAAADEDEDGSQKLQQARQQLEDGVELDPGHAGLRIALGEVLSRIGDNQAALAQLDVAVEAQPDSAMALGTRGKVRRALDHPGAIDDLRRAAELDKSIPWVHKELGNALRMAGFYPEAIDALKSAVALDDSDAELWAIKGAAESGAGLYEDGRASLSQALDLQPGYAWAQGLEAWLLLTIDELEPALSMVEQALSEAPSMWWAWNTKGRLLEVLEHDPAESQDAFEHAEAGGPDLDAEIGIGEALMRQHRVAEANERFEHVISDIRARDKLDAQSSHSLGWSLLRLGQYDEALQAIAEAAGMDEALIEANFDIALTLLCADRGDVALEEYRAAALRTRVVRHAGRRRNLIRIALRDLANILPEESDPPQLDGIYEILAEVPLRASAGVREGGDASVKLLFIPSVYKCRIHDRNLTEEVRAKVEATEIPVSSFGWQHDPAEKTQEAFRVQVRCPEGDGHDLTFRGTYGPE